MVQYVLEALDAERAGILAIGWDLVDPSDFSPQSFFHAYTCS